ncbi:MAG: M48 family metalloprotease, partial [Planctomycetaceae bacterium]|nr:M48 family metalloprotease [Planctomycetaceae bacterium]
MSSAFLEIGLINALVTTLLAVFVWLITRHWKNPFLATLLWSALLIKLVTPPLFSVAFSVPSSMQAWFVSPPAEEIATTQSIPPAWDTTHDSISSPLSPTSMESKSSVNISPSPLPLSPELQQELERALSEKQPFSVESQNESPSPPPLEVQSDQQIPEENTPPEFTSPEEPVFVLSGITPQNKFPENQTSSERIATSPSDTEALTDISSTDEKVSALTWLWSPQLWITFWLSTSLFFLLLMIKRSWQFSRLLKNAVQGSEILQTRTSQIAQQIGLKSVPHVFLVEAAVSPMIWPFGRRASILLPSHLLDSLTEQKQNLVIAHELIHLKRKDHLFRWFELTVLALYWWLPIVRFIRRELHIAQEKCCDAWVCHFFPENRFDYGETLLATAELLQTPTAAPLLATEFGRPNSLRIRIETMLNSDHSLPLNRRTFLTCL